MATHPTQQLNKAKDEVKAAVGEVRRDLPNAAGAAMDRSREAATGVMDRAKEVAGNVADRARDMASTAVDRAKDAASTVGQKAEDGLGAVGSGMGSLAGTIRDHIPQQGVLHSVGESVAEGLENSGRYLREEGFKGMADDLTGMIRNHPIPAVLVGIGLGFLLARSTSSRS